MINLAKLARAIERRLGVPPGDASAKAKRLLDYFGFRTVIIDNAIASEDRKLFYELQDAGLLRSSWETVLLLSGRNWRIFYWEIVEADLDRLLVENRKAGEPLYERLPDEAWGHSPATT